MPLLGQRSAHSQSFADPVDFFFLHWKSLTNLIFLRGMGVWWSRPFFLFVYVFAFFLVFLSVFIAHFYSFLYISVNFYSGSVFFVMFWVFRVSFFLLLFVSFSLFNVPRKLDVEISAPMNREVPSSQDQSLSRWAPTQGFKTFMDVHGIPCILNIPLAIHMYE